MCIDYILFIHSFISGHLGYFRFLAIVKNATVNIGVQISIRVTTVSILGRLPKSGIAGWADSQSPASRAIFKPRRDE